MNDLCFYCESSFGLPVYGSNTPLRKTRDHIIPKSKNGNGCEQNIIPSCHQCNALKGDALPEQFSVILEHRIKALQIGVGRKSYLYSEERYSRVLKNNNALIIKISEYRQTLFRSHKCKPASKNKPTVKQRKKAEERLRALPTQPQMLYNFSELYTKEEQYNFHYEEN